MNDIAMQRLAKDLASELRECGVTEVMVYFSGGGDSGSIDGVEFKPTGLNLSGRVSWDEQYSSYDAANGWTQLTRRTSDTYEKGVEALCYAMLENTGIDWVNNEGGSGEVKLMVHYDPIRKESTLKYNTVIEEYFQSSTTHHLSGNF